MAELPPDEIRAMLIASARAREAMTYSQVLGMLGHRFTRPLMRQLCSVLDRIDEDARAAGEPELAVLVVRQSDGLPGQGWFVLRSQESGDEPDWPDQWEGPGARRYVERYQRAAFDYWQDAA